MTISYTSKAKEDLIKLDWRIRHAIIGELNEIKQNKDFSKLKKVYDSSFYKINYQDHLIIGKVDNNNLSVITVLERKKIAIPS
jgi:mRNA-degrading endonuclease RelE of RelBE toxin-antitoxin system